jgi:hypothetical protein
MPASEEQSAKNLAKEIFLDAAGARTVRLAAEVLATCGIVPMPLKGVLLQRWVYANGPFRPIRDVDLLVPEDRFFDAVAALNAAGFSEAHWERGRWQVTIFNPAGPRLGIDLHRRLTRTHRARLTSAGMFQRAAIDTRLFGAPIMLPCPEDLFAHLLLHATLHWLNLGKLHRPDDLEAVARTLALDSDRCVAHLQRQGMLPHAALMLPLIAEHARGGFVDRLTIRLPRPARARAWIARTFASHFPVGNQARRLAGLALAPSLSEALVSAMRDRIEDRART